MLEAITVGGIVQGGAVGVLLLVAWMVFTGKLTTSRELTDVRKDRDDRLALMQEIINNLQKAYLASEAARVESSSQVNQLLELGRIAEALLRAMHQVSTNRDLPPGGDAP